MTIKADTCIMLCLNESVTQANIGENCSLPEAEAGGGGGDYEIEAGWLQERFSRAQYVICPLLFVVGIVGNAMTILTVTKPQFRQLTSRYILCALVIADSLLLSTNPFNQQFMPSLMGQDVRALSKIGCKLFFIAYRTGKITASWCVVLVASERFIAVWFPLKVKTIVTRTTISVAIVTISMITITFSATWMFSTDIVDGVCVPDFTTAETRALHKRFVFAGAMCYSIAPILILSTITPPIIVRLVRQQHRQKDLHSSTMSRFARETNRTTIMLTIIVLVYIVCVTPITLVLVLTFWTDEPIFGSLKKEFIILTSVAQAMEQVNHSMNFTIYVLCSRQFRLRFLKMIGCLGTENEATQSLSFPVLRSQTVASGYQDIPLEHNSFNIPVHREARDMSQFS